MVLSSWLSHPSVEKKGKAVEGVEFPCRELPVPTGSLGLRAPTGMSQDGPELPSALPIFPQHIPQDWSTWCSQWEQG